MERISLVKKKVCLLGAFAVGKTSTVEQFVFSRFADKYLTTLGVKVSQKTMPPVDTPGNGNRKQFQFLIWDIAGVERFDTTTKNYYRGASGALVVADLTRPDTIGTAIRIIESFKTVNPSSELIIIGNKTDIFQKDEKTITHIEHVAMAYGTDYLLVSAKTGENVDRAFLLLAEKIGMA